jgi:predicted RNA methylase
VSNTPLVDRCVEDPGYTPPVKALPELIAAFGALDDDRAEKLERTLARVGIAAAEVALMNLQAAEPKARRRRLRLAGRIAASTHDANLLGPLTAALEDSVPACRRAAATALGKLEAPGAEAPLLAALASSAIEEQRAIVEALGKLGGERALETLRALSTSDPELARRRERAVDMLLRRLSRGAEASTITFDRALPKSIEVIARSRAGLSQVLQGELAHLGATVQSASEVRIHHHGTLGELLTARSALDFALSFEITDKSSSPAERVAATLVRDDVLSCLGAWTSGRPRFRIAWGQGHQRAQSWEVARLVRERTADVINDPSSAPWEARVSAAGTGRLELVPRLEPDPRFLYRKRDVPAASHPTLAAALVRLGGVRENDVVWDPFVGSGLELVERARLGPYLALYGTDIDARALEATRENLDSAGVERATLELVDARRFARRDVTLIVSNPPMGRRVARDASLRTLLCEVTTHAAQVLAPGGRLVWLSPLAEATAQTARAAGLTVTEGPDVDLGGFTARVQTFTKRA